MPRRRLGTQWHRGQTRRDMDRVTDGANLDPQKAEADPRTALPQDADVMSATTTSTAALADLGESVLIHVRPRWRNSTIQPREPFRGHQARRVRVSLASRPSARNVVTYSSIHIACLIARSLRCSHNADCLRPVLVTIVAAPTGATCVQGCCTRRAEEKPVIRAVGVYCYIVLPVFLIVVSAFTAIFLPPLLGIPGNVWRSNCSQWAFLPAVTYFALPSVRARQALGKFTWLALGSLSQQRCRRLRSLWFGSWASWVGHI